VPGFEPAAPRFHLLDAAALVGIGGVWIWAFVSELRTASLVPLHATRVERVPADGD
jgi:hypothetical protein